MQAFIKSISCQDSVRLVSASRDHGLSFVEVNQLNHHVAHCPRCQVARQQFSVLFATLDELLAIPLDQGTDVRT